MKALAIDLGGTHATCAVVEDRSILDAQAVEASATSELKSLLPVFAETFRALGARAGVRIEDCAGLSFGFCGLVDARTGKVVSTDAKYDDAPALDLPRWSREALGLPMRIENDARLALLGERYAGGARGYDDVVMMTLGTGIGGAAMIGGRLLRGKHAQAGCLGGHLPVRYDGRACTCGNIGCAEAEASGWALPAVVKEWPGVSGSGLSREENLGFAALFEQAEKRDAVAMAVLDRCLRVWSAAAVGMIHAYDPEVVVIGGGVMKSAGTILPFVQSHVDEYAWTPWGKVQVRAAELGNQAGLLGAIPLLTEGE